jgi:hypothetical protein
MSLSDSQIERLRVEFPEAYEERSELIDLRARLWNALVWFDSENDKFRGRIAGLAFTLRDRHTREHGDEHGNPLISVCNKMARNYWVNSWTER